MVYVYKKNKQINKWNERINTKIIIIIIIINTSTVGITAIAMSKSHLRSNHWANGGVENSLNVIDE